MTAGENHAIGIHDTRVLIVNVQLRVMCRATSLSHRVEVEVYGFS